MATYGTIYRMQFRDKKDLLWRVDFRLKNAGETDTPLVLQYGGGEPMVINWENSNEDQFAPIIGSKASITYYRNSDTDPSPETFINIEEDEWLIDISKMPDNITPVLFWRGFVKPDNNQYPWVPMPYSFTINAVDFTFTKGTVVNLNNVNQFLYDYITIGDFINRSLFNSVGYNDSIVKILFNIKPTVVGLNNITESLYLHTDAFYDFVDGAKFCYDALHQVLSSLDARIFYSAGSYWIQRVQDIGTSPQEIITITPDDTAGIESENYDILQTLGNTPSNTIFYLGRTQVLTVNPALKKQIVSYDLQGINQLLNFDWRSFTAGVPDEWSGGSAMSITRVGSGSLTDPYRLRIPPNGSSTFVGINQGIPIQSGQLLQFQVKVRGNYAKDIAVGVQLGIASSAQYCLTESGDWVAPTTGSTSNIVFPLTISSKDVGNINILSKPIPNNLTTDTAYVFISVPVAKSGVPIGETVYVDVYPVFLKRFDNPYVKIQEDITNSKKYSFVPEGKEKFFLDTQDTGLSNTIFYDDGGVKSAIPLNDWEGKTIDETVLRGELDQQNKPSYSFDGDVFSNELSFHHAITLTDFGNKTMMLLRDKYSIMSCVHSIYATEIMPIGAGIGTYTVTPLTQDE